MGNQTTPTWIKSIAMISGLLLSVIGFWGVGICCTLGGTAALTIPSSVAFLAGVTMLWQGVNALRQQSSDLIGLPPAPVIIGVFAFLMLYIAATGQERFFLVPFSPIVIILTGSLPPLAATSWFFAGRPGHVTWRTGLISLASGATGAVLVAILLEALLPGLLTILVSNLDTGRIERVLTALSNANVATAITDPGFVLLFVQLAVIAPLAEEFAKPLFTLPILKNRLRRDAFLIGALAGAGFAMVENAIYASMAYRFAAGILIVRSIGCAIHPLGAGLVALGWRECLQREPQAGPRWWQRFGAAASLHALWNGASLLIITLAGAEFFGDLPPEIDLLGISAAGTTLAFLIVLGIATLLLGRRIANPTKQALAIDTGISNRAAAMWAVACLLALVPMGITGLKLLFE